MSIVPDIAPPLAHVIDRALKFDKKDRWPSASEMRKAYWRATGRDDASLPKDPVPGERHLQMPDTPDGAWPTITPRPRGGSDPSLRPGNRVPSDPSIRPAQRVPSDPSLRPARPGSNPSFGPVATSFSAADEPELHARVAPPAEPPGHDPGHHRHAAPVERREGARESPREHGGRPGERRPRALHASGALRVRDAGRAPPPPKPPSKVRLYIAIVIAIAFVAVAATLVGIMYGVEEKKPPPVIELQ